MSLRSIVPWVMPRTKAARWRMVPRTPGRSRSATLRARGRLELHQAARRLQHGSPFLLARLQAGQGDTLAGFDQARRVLGPLERPVHPVKAIGGLSEHRVSPPA